MIVVEMRGHRGDRPICQARDDRRDIAQAGTGVEEQRPLLATDQIVPVDLVIFGLADRDEGRARCPRSHTSRRTSGTCRLHACLPRRSRATRHAGLPRKTASARRRAANSDTRPRVIEKKYGEQRLRSVRQRENQGGRKQCEDDTCATSLGMLAGDAVAHLLHDEVLGRMRHFPLPHRAKPAEACRIAMVCVRSALSIERQ